MDNQTDRDLVSDLPLDIIHRILTLVPIRDAVRTCILSKQWRYNWASLPHLVFKNKCVDRSLSAGERIECLKTMVNNVLCLHKGPIQKFELEFHQLSESYRCPNTDLWLLWLSTREIQEVCIRWVSITMHNRFQVHSNIYSCRKLTHLELYGCELPPPPPTFKGFLCLRSLVLISVEEGPSDLVESLVADSVFLENFKYDECHDPGVTGSSDLRISAPILKCFGLWGHFKEISLYAPLVKKVSVTLSNTDFTAEQQSFACNYIKFLGGLTNLKCLTGSEYFTKYLSIGIESYGHSLVFHQLKSICLHNVSFEDKKQMLVVGHLITGAPNLQKFEISINTYSPISHLDFGWAPNLTLKLRAFRMIVATKLGDVGRFPYELEFIKTVLRSSTTLETMTILSSLVRLSPDGMILFEDPNGMTNMITKVLSFSRASPNAKILFQFPYEKKLEFSEL